MNKKDKKPDNKVLNTILSNIFIWIVIVVVAFSIASNFSSYEKIKNVSYNEYKKLIENREISEATLTGNNFKGELNTEISIEDDNGRINTYNFISVELPEATTDQADFWV